MNPKQIEEQARLLESGTPWLCTVFALRVKGADILALQKRVMEIGESWICYYFAVNIPGAEQEGVDRMARLNFETQLLDAFRQCYSEPECENVKSYEEMNEERRT